MSYESDIVIWSGADDMGFVLEGQSRQDLVDKLHKDCEESIERFRIEIAHLTTHHSVKNALSKTILNGHLNTCAENYAKDEKLPGDYLNVALNAGALKVLIIRLLATHLDENHIADVIYWRVESFCNRIYENYKLESVYSRVGRAQRFMHETLNEELGVNFAETMPSTEIRHTLSALRLHLFINDYKHCSYLEIIRSIESDLERSRIETVQSQTSSPIKGKRQIKRWSYKHLLPLTEYDYHYDNISKNLIEIAYCDESLPIETFKDLIIRRWSREIESAYYSSAYLGDKRGLWYHKHRRWV